MSALGFLLAYGVLAGVGAVLMGAVLSIACGDLDGGGEKDDWP